jgi:hypothetical protein
MSCNQSDTPGSDDPSRGTRRRGAGVSCQDGRERRDEMREARKRVQTWYSPTSGQYGELLNGTDAELKRRCLRLDSLHSRVDRRKARKGKQQSGRRTARQRGRTSCQRNEGERWIEAAHYVPPCRNHLLRLHLLDLLHLFLRHHQCDRV